MKILRYSWSDPPIDILCEIANRLPYEDLVRFAAVCKSWRVIIYRVHLQQRSPLRMPCLISYGYICQKDQHRVSFFDISVQKTYLITLKVVREEFTTFVQLDSKYGWSIVGNKWRKSKPVLVLYNPFTNEIIQLPQLNLSTNCVRKATFTSPPTCPDCVVLVLCKEEEEEGCIIGTCKPGDKIWRFRKTGGFKDWYAVKNVTYLNGIFCFLIRKSQPWSLVLGTLDVALEDDSVDMDYTSISVVQEGYRYSEDLWLVESDGKLLLAVLRTYEGVIKPSYWNVYRFDWSRKDWTRVQGLGNQVLILRQRWFNATLSIACPTSGEESKFANMIFFDGVGGTQSFTCTSQDGVWRRPS